MANRRRKNIVQVNMTDGEYAKFKERFAESGRNTITEYGIDALIDGQVTSQECIDAVNEANINLSELQKIERGIGTNINQIAHKVNMNGYATEQDINNLVVEFYHARERRNALWQSTRLLLTELKRIGN